MPATPLTIEDILTEPVRDTKPTPGWHRLGSVGVDSGQLMITDPCYVESWGGDNRDEGSQPTGYNKSNGPFTYDYNGACKATLSHKKAGYLDQGVDAVAFSSGYGDGSYGVYGLYNMEGRIIQVTVMMGDFNELELTPELKTLVRYEYGDDDWTDE